MYCGGQVAPNNNNLCTTTESGVEVCIRTTRRELPEEPQADLCGCTVEPAPELNGEDRFYLTCNGLKLLISGENLEQLRQEGCE